jgi:16S rRNA processing protein RimM
VVLGIIVRTHGLKGEVKIRLTCSGLDRIKNCHSLRLVRDGVEIKKVTLMRAFLHNDGDAVLRFKEVVGVEEAELLRGAALAVSAEDKISLPGDAYFIDDLVGLRVETLDGLDVGVVEEVLEMPASWVCVVKRGAAETLIPFLKTVVHEVDLKAGRMRVELPEEIDGDADAAD